VTSALAGCFLLNFFGAILNGTDLRAIFQNSFADGWTRVSILLGVRSVKKKNITITSLHLDPLYFSFCKFTVKGEKVTTSISRVYEHEHIQEVDAMHALPL
jgi:hypothetical protein